MSSEPLPGFPPLDETHHSRESLLHALSTEATLPSEAVAAATLYAEDLAPDFLAVIQRAAIEELDPFAARLFFRGVHILGGRRFSSAYRPLVSFLRGPQHRVEELLGDAVTETLPKILAGVFDGDAGPLHALIADTTLDPFVREAALKALGFLAFDGRIDRDAVKALLLRFDQEPLAPPDDDAMWHGWMTVVGVLGFEELAPRVRAAFADGRIPPEFCNEDDFESLLEAAIQRPDDGSRFVAESMGYIDDVLVELEWFNKVDDGAPDDSDVFGDDVLDWLEPSLPAHNPFRNVGRNDPCPCGSGKKAKKCCLR